MPNNWTPYAIIKQIESCGFVDEQGHKIELNDAFIFLKKALEKDHIQFFMGQTVYYEVEFINADYPTIKEWKPFMIVGIKRNSDSTEVYFEYDLSNNPCQPYYAGKVNHTKIRGNLLRAAPPESEATNADN